MGAQIGKDLAKDFHFSSDRPLNDFLNMIIPEPAAITDLNRALHDLVEPKNRHAAPPTGPRWVPPQELSALPNLGTNSGTNLAAMPRVSNASYGPQAKAVPPVPPSDLGMISNPQSKLMGASFRGGGQQFNRLAGQSMNINAVNGVPSAMASRNITSAGGGGFTGSQDAMVSATA